MTGNDLILFSRRPMVLSSPRVWRSYTGGMKIEEWQGLPDPRDGEFPEVWVASIVTARNPGREHIVEGLSMVDLGRRSATLKEMIESDPVAFLGEEHVKKYGANTAVLAKVLDSKSRLPIQVHPDREFARNVLASQFGKTEAWYVLGGRQVDGEDPYLLFGFKPGMTREKWKELFEKQDIHGMINSLHRFPVVPGQVLLIEGGMPHAIGPGCFLIEIQEPTDYTIRVERKMLNGRPIAESYYHQGVGFEKMFDCFHYDSYSYEETLKRWRLQPRTIREETGGSEYELIGYADTDKFRLTKLEISDSLELQADGCFSTLIVLSGSGRIIVDGQETELRKAGLIFLPASLRSFRIQATPGEELAIVRCHPPE
ncbi:MAG TPA: mannose-6-phosphate isomerase [Firmicutes bacterium]|nr:mannose-6-phosphate isomerase [Bacillota bacterium]